MNSEKISAGKAVQTYGNKGVYIYLCTVKPILKIKDTLVKSEYYITFYTICHFVVLFSNICNRY